MSLPQVASGLSLAQEIALLFQLAHDVQALEVRPEFFRLYACHDLQTSSVVLEYVLPTPCTRWTSLYA